MSARMALSRLGGRAGLLLALAAFALPPVAAATSDDAERAQIATERAALESRYAAATHECRERFVVTSCVDDAKRERRKGLDALKARQLALDEAKRRARTAERSAELAAKAADDAKREHAPRAGSASAPAARHDGLPRAAAMPHAGAASAVPREVPHGRPSPGAASGAKTGHAESAETRQANEARSRASFATRQRQAAEHREEVIDKTTRHMTEKRPADSLPVPAPSSAASR
jgi:colicin import membrane protein